MVNSVRGLGIGSLLSVLLALLVGMGQRVYASGPSDSAHLADRSRLLLRLAETVYWPATAQDSTFHIELLDTTSMLREPLLRLERSRRVHGKPLIVTQTNSWVDHLDKGRPHIFYVSAAFTRWLPQIHAHFSGAPVLVVSEMPYSGPGAMASFERVARASGRSGRSDASKGVLVWSLNLTNMFSIAGLTTYPQTDEPDWVTRPAKKAPPKIDKLSYAAALDSLPRLVAQLALQRDTVLSLRRQLVDLRWLVDSFKLAGSLYVPAALAANADSFQSSRSFLTQSYSLGPELPNPSPSSSLFPYILGMGVLVAGGALAIGLATQGSALLNTLRAYPSQIARGAGGFLLAFGARAHRGHSSRGYVDARFAPLNSYAQPSSSVSAITRKRYLEEVSHVIRTPLNAIVGLSQYIATPAASEEEKREGVGLIHRSVFELTTRLNSMMLLAKLEAKGIEEHPDSIQLAELLRRIEELESQQIAALGRADSMLFRCVMPDLADAVRIWADTDNLAITIDMLLAIHLRTPECRVIELGYESVDQASVRLFVRGITADAYDVRMVRAFFADRRPVDQAYIDSLPECVTELSVAVGLQALRTAAVDVATAQATGVEYSVVFPALR